MGTELTLAECRKLLGILAHLGSDHDGERAAAGLLASRLLAAKHMTCSDIIAPVLPAPEPHASRHWFDNVVTCLDANELLSRWEAGCIANNLRTRDSISAKQRGVLAEIVEEVTARCTA